MTTTGLAEIEEHAREASHSTLEVLLRAKQYPELRYMGSKHRLLPWIHEVLSQLPFESAHDPFCGTGCVAYLMKSMGKQVVATDFLNMSATIATATVENSDMHLESQELEMLTAPATEHRRGFVELTFDGVFFTPRDLRFIDTVALRLEQLDHPYKKAIARAALIRSCLKKQPRGVFTVSGDLSKYDDGRRDLKISLEEHFVEQTAVFNRIVFSNDRRNLALRADVFSDGNHSADLVYLDPPYVPRSDDNCYIKRYHFIEGLSSYWKDLKIDHTTKVKKIPKVYTPFSYRRTAVDAFDSLFAKFRDQIIVLSYSSNGFPDLHVLESLLRRYKRSVAIHRRPHRYHFGTHANVERAVVDEYLIVGT